MNFDLKKRARLFFVYLLYFTLAIILVIQRPLNFMPVYGDFLLVLPIMVGYRYGSRAAVYIALISGLIRDWLASYLFGFGMLSTLLIALLATVLLQGFFQRKWPYVFLRVIILSIIYELSLIFALDLFPWLLNQEGLALNFKYYFFERILWQILANLMVTAFYLALFILLPPRAQAKIDFSEEVDDNSFLI